MSGPPPNLRNASRWSRIAKVGATPQFFAQRIFRFQCCLRIRSTRQARSILHKSEVSYIRHLQSRNATENDRPFQPASSREPLLGTRRAEPLDDHGETSRVRSSWAPQAPQPAGWPCPHHSAQATFGRTSRSKASKGSV